jgi:hypothetical protein
MMIVVVWLGNLGRAFCQSLVHSRDAMGFVGGVTFLLEVFGRPVGFPFAVDALDLIGVSARIVRPGTEATMLRSDVPIDI